MSCESLQRADEAAFRVRSAKQRLIIDSWLQFCDIVAFGEVRDPAGRYRRHLLLLHYFWGLRVVAEHRVELLSCGLRVVAAGRHIRLYWGELGAVGPR